MCIAITSLGEKRANLSGFRTFFSICACFVLAVSSWCLGRIAVCDCGTSWTFLLPFFDSYPYLEQWFCPYSKSVKTQE